MKTDTSTATQPPAPRLMYDKKEAARQLSISLRSLDYLIAESSIRCRRLKGRVLISNVELQRFSDSLPEYVPTAKGTGTPDGEPQLNPKSEPQNGD